MADFEPKDVLELFLGLNGKSRMPPDAWEFLTIRDLITCASISKEIRQKLLISVEYTRCRDGRDYLVPFPGFPGLLSTSEDLKVGAGLFPHQLASLQAMHRMENADNLFGSLRGGILGDAPGLGKTITMLALIASTAGRRPVPPPEFWDVSGVADGWRCMRINPTAQQEILTALRPIRTWVQTNLSPQSVEFKQYQEMTRYVSPPFEDSRFPTIRDLELHVYGELRQFVPRAELELFRSNMIDMKAGLDKRNRKLLKGAMGRRLIQERKLIPSSATLIVVPDALLEHWFQQIHNHLDLRRFEDTNVPGLRNIVYVDGMGDFVDVRLPLQRASRGIEVPPAYLLSQYFIVITTFSRCEAEFENQVRWGQARAGVSVGSSTRKPKSDVKSKPNAKPKSRKRRRSQSFHEPPKLEDESKKSSLLRIRWLRLVVDEGHELGTHAAPTNTTRFIHEIAAERRWVLSGTPTTGDEDNKDFAGHALDQLQRLLMFLRHPEYGDLPSSGSFEDSSERVESRRKDDAKKQWIQEVKAPFLEKKEGGRLKLLQVLTECLVMHRKEDLRLPKPTFPHAEVNVPVPEEVQSKMRKNIDSAVKLLDKYLRTDAYQLLVDEAQAKHIMKTVQKAKDDLMSRGGCIRNSGAGVVADYELMDFSDDRRPVKAVVYSRNRNDLLSVTEFFLKEMDRQNIAELYDPKEIKSMGSEMSRFRNDFKEVQVCPICRRETDVTLQEGRGNHKCMQTLVEVLEENYISETPSRFLIEPERIMRALGPAEGGNVVTSRMGGEPFTVYGTNQRFWRPGDTLEVDIRANHPLLPKRWDENQWVEYGLDKCIELAELNSFQGPEWYFGPLPQNERGQNTTRVTLAKWQKCCSFHHRWYTGPRLCDSVVQRIDEDVFLLSLDADLSHGLDLSFVTHMFLLEPIEDAALLEQVTSRAHRLGARGSVTVETVNVFYTLSPETEERMDKARLNKGETSFKQIRLEEKRQALTKECCQHCFRAFDSKAEAEHHEQTNCPRNPDIMPNVDRFHLSAVYKEIKPPPAVHARTPVGSI